MRVNDAALVNSIGCLLFALTFSVALLQAVVLMMILVGWWIVHGQAVESS